MTLDLTDPQKVLAGTIYGEARGEGEEGMQAVACVIMNRAKSKITWWGSGVIGVCLKPYQFYCWHINNTNRLKILTVKDKDPQFVQAMDIARQAIGFVMYDITLGADSYFNPDECSAPNWAKNKPPTIVIGKHWFYKVY